MERDILDNRLQGLRESEVPYPAGYDLDIDSDKGVVEVGSDPKTHPLRSDRIRPTASEETEDTDPTG